MKNTHGVICRYKDALKYYRKGMSMKSAFEKVGVDRNTVSRTAPIAELSIAAPEVFCSIPPWNEKTTTLRQYANECKNAITGETAEKIKQMKATGELLPIV